VSANICGHGVARKEVKRYEVYTIAPESFGEKDHSEKVTQRRSAMEQEARIAQLEQENDALYTELGKETPRMKAERERLEADEAHQRELAELEISALPEYLSALERQGLSLEWDALDQLDEMLLRGWQKVVEARTTQMAAKKRIEQFLLTFGGTLPPSWQRAREEWLTRQPRRPEASSGQVWHRNKVAQVVRGLVGRSR